MAEEVLDNLPEIGKVTASTIAQIRKDQEDVRSKLSDQVERYSEKAKISDAKDKPGQLLAKAIDSVNAIDSGVVARLSNEKREELSEAISILEDAINELKGVL